MFPWTYGFAPKAAPKTERELLLERLAGGVPPELAEEAAGITLDRTDPEIKKALAEGQILLFERARDAGVTGVIRAAMRYESKTWQQKAEPVTGLTLEDYLRG